MMRTVFNIEPCLVHNKTKGGEIMKIIITALLILSLSVAFTGCGSDTVNDINSGVQSGMDSVEDKVESGANDIKDDVTNNSNDTAKITKDEAKKIAFKHAGVNESDTYDIPAELETDNGVLNYEVDFETKTTEYDYHINAQTGDIMSSSKEPKD